MTPSTPSIGHIFALQSKLEEIFEEGLEARFDRHAKTNALVHNWIRRAGFDFFAEEGFRSKTLTCVKNNKGIDVVDLAKRLREKHHLVIDGGYGKLKGYHARLVKLVGLVEEELRRWEPNVGKTAEDPEQAKRERVAFDNLRRQLPELRSAYIPWPRPYLYEHPCSECALLLEREYQGENIVLGARLRAPETQSLQAIDAQLRYFRETPVEDLDLHAIPDIPVPPNVQAVGESVGPALGHLAQRVTRPEGSHQRDALVAEMAFEKRFAMLVRSGLLLEQRGVADGLLTMRQIRESDHRSVCAGHQPSPLSAHRRRPPIGPRTMNRRRWSPS